MRTSLLALLLLVAAASRGGASPPHRSGRNLLLGLQHVLRRAANTCTQAGQTVCNSDCNQVNMCVSDGLGGFQLAFLEECRAGTRCSAELGMCVSGGSACGGASSGSFACHAIGYFPDPYDCTRYHLCLMVNSDSVVQYCLPGYAYNPVTFECSYLTTDRICTEGPVPTCTHVRQSGPVPTNPTIYYVCSIDANGILTPQLYKCPSGEIFDPNLLSCVNGPITPPPPPPPTTTTTTTTRTTPTEAPPTPPPVGPGAPCWPAGVRLADPEDCTHYYECSENLVWLHAACTFGTYFNPVHARCELGWC